MYHIYITICDGIIPKRTGRLFQAFNFPWRLSRFLPEFLLLLLSNVLAGQTFGHTKKRDPRTIKQMFKQKQRFKKAVTS